MTKNKIKELRELSQTELVKMRTDIEKTVRTYRFKAKIERPTNPMEKHNLRKKIAVINTLIREKQIKDQQGAGA